MRANHIAKASFIADACKMFLGASLVYFLPLNLRPIKYLSAPIKYLKWGVRRIFTYNENCRLEKESGI